MTSRLKRWCVLAGLLFSGAAPAQTCSFLALPDLNFGAYSALSGADDAESTVQLSCIPNLLAGPTVSYSISLSPGTGNPADFYPRRLVSGAFGLDYNLYTDIARTTIWGDGTGGTAVVGGSCAAVCVVPVYGRIAPGQSVPAAEYRDDVLVTVDF